MYLNIYYQSASQPNEQSYIHIWDDDLGTRRYRKIPYQKYAYKIDENGDYKTLYGQPCKLVRRWKKEDLENGLIFESDIHPEMRFLVDNYTHSDNPSDSHVVLNFDIEVSTDGGLPNINDANNTITSIAYYNSLTKEYTVHLLDPTSQIKNLTMNQRGEPVNIKSHINEIDLLNSFLSDYENIKPTILTGWNIDSFDIPYLYHRLNVLFGNEVANRLSPIGIINYNEFQQRYFIAGVSCLDMMKLYKNFTFGQRQSYSLDAIAKLELGEGKVKYEGTLDKLYLEDKEKFIDYNVHDVRLVKMIDDKMQLILLAKGICHKGHVPLEDVYFSSRFLDGAILTYLKRKGKIVVPNRPNNNKYSENDEPTFEGAYVKEPKPGLYRWLVDLDATSMYPSIIMTLNISPECKVGKIENWNNLEYKKDVDRKYRVIIGDEILEFDKNKFKNFVKSENLGISSNGVLYQLPKKILGKVKNWTINSEMSEFDVILKNEIFKIEKNKLESFLKNNNLHIDSEGNLYEDKTGIIPEILEKWFEERTEMKKLVKKHGKQLNDDGTININYDKDKLEFYDARQKIQKTLLNSLYGVLGLPTFRYYDLDNAEAVTKTGVDLIKFAQSSTNLYYEKQLNRKDDYIIYTDTDSLFVSIEKLIVSKYPEISLDDDDKIVNIILKIAQDIQLYVNKSMDYFSYNFLNVKKHKFNMKQEVIAKSGLWTTKKRYALWAINIEGRKVDELIVKGLDVVRTSFPNVFRDFMNKMLRDILMSKPKEKIDEDIINLQKLVEYANVSDIARPTSIKEISKYCDNSHTPFIFKVKGTPAHVKSAVNYNDFLRYYKLNNKFSYISDGEKIKWVYIKPNNPFKIESLAFRDNDEDPQVILDFIEKYVDRDKIFDSEMEKKLQDFYDALGWGNIPRDTYDNYSKFF